MFYKTKTKIRRWSFPPTLGLFMLMKLMHFFFHYLTCTLCWNLTKTSQTVIIKELSSSIKTITFFWTKTISLGIWVVVTHGLWIIVLCKKHEKIVHCFGKNFKRKYVIKFLVVFSSLTPCSTVSFKTLALLFSFYALFNMKLNLEAWKFEREKKYSK